MKSELTTENLYEITKKYYQKEFEKRIMETIFYKFPNENKQLTFFERLRTNIIYKIYEFRMKLASLIAGFDVTENDY